MPGVEPARITIELSDLRKLSPGLDERVYEEAKKLLSGFREDKAKDRKAIMWGHALQTSYSDLVTEILALAQTPVLVKVNRYLGRMMEILGAIDLLAACGHGSGLLQEYFRGVNSKIDTPAELSAAHAELDELVGHMNNALEQLLELKEEIEKRSERIDLLSIEVEASALAALFLSIRLREDKGQIAQHFTERSMSLTQCLVQIRESTLMRQSQIEQPIRMITAIQNIALVMLPGFLGSIASLVTLSRRISLTEANELHDQLRIIQTNLK